MVSEDIRFKDRLINGLITENPVLVQLIGMCPTLAVSTSVDNGFGMGVATMLVLMCSNAVISALRGVIPNKIRLAAYVTIVAGFVAIIDMLMQAFMSPLSSSLGIYIPLIAVNCIVFGRAESYASKNTVTDSILDGFTMGLGFTFALVFLSALREIIGFGTITLPFFGQLFDLKASGFYPISIFILPSGGFLTLGIIIAIIQRKKRKGR